MPQSSLPVALLRLKVGGTPLTPTEIAVLRLLARGMSIGAVAEARSVAPDTIRKTAKVARARLGARTTAQAIAIAVSLDLI